MLVNAKEMIRKAVENKYAIAHININNLEWTKLVLEVCEETKSPVILGVSEGAMKYMGGYRTVAKMVKSLHDSLKITVPVALHLDHGTFEGAVQSIAEGFTSVMFDGSHFSFEENYAKTKEIVKLAKQHGVSVEAEVGTIGGEEDGVVGNGELACPIEAGHMISLGIDILAAGIGNIHGPYPENWQGLNFEVLQNLQTKTNNFPLVLHGGSGIPEDQIKKAIELGIRKINVNTELQLAFAKGVREYIEKGKDLQGKGFDPRKLLSLGIKYAKETVVEKLTLFGSLGKAFE